MDHEHMICISVSLGFWVKCRTIYGYYAALLQCFGLDLIAAARVDDDHLKCPQRTDHDQRLCGFATSQRRANAGCRSAEAAKAGDRHPITGMVFGAGGTAA
jgi:hypothetical protein